MRRHDDRDADLTVEAEQHVQEVALGHGVELRGRLVEQQQPRTHRHHARKVNELLLTAGQPLGPAMHPRLDAEELRDFRHPPAHDRRRGPEVLKPEGELMPDAVADDLVVRVLRDVPDARRGFRQPPLAERSAEDPHLACTLARRCDLGLQTAQQGRLTASRHPDEQAERTLWHLP